MTEPARGRSKGTWAGAGVAHGGVRGGGRGESQGGRNVELRGEDGESQAIVPGNR